MPAMPRHSPLFATALAMSTSGSSPSKRTTLSSSGINCRMVSGANEA
jgi:hypothetical protein